MRTRAGLRFVDSHCGPTDDGRLPWLIDRLSDCLTGDLRTIALKLLKGKRTTDDSDAESADHALAALQAKELHHDMAGQAIEILCANSPAQNAAIARIYEDEYDCSLNRAIGQE